MKMKIDFVIHVAMLTLVSVFIVTSICYGKRKPPEVLGAVEYKDLIIVAIPSLLKYQKHTQKAGAYLEIRDKQTNNLMWWIQVYSIDYKKDLEKDIQDVFIKHLEVTGNEIMVVNELDMVFSINLDTKAVRQIKGMKKQSEHLPVIEISGITGGS